MGAPLAPTAKAATGVWPLYRAMVGVGVFCGLAIVVVYLWTLPRIQRNRAEALQRAIFQVLPEARSSATFRLVAQDAFEASEATASTSGERVVYAGYDDGGALIGVAVEAQRMGYQDVIRVLYGYSIAEEAVVGIRVLESKETPGLGDRIETDAGFLKNFERLDVGLADDGAAVAHPIEIVKPGKREQPWQVDTITGATISSNAVGEMLRESTGFWIPRIRRRADDLKQAG